MDKKLVALLALCLSAAQPVCPSQHNNPDNQLPQALHSGHQQKVDDQVLSRSDGPAVSNEIIFGNHIRGKKMALKGKSKHKYRHPVFRPQKPRNKYSNSFPAQQNLSVHTQHGKESGGVSTQNGMAAKDRATFADHNQHHYIPGFPDMSDPCFRRYASCTVVNAQPFERRSGVMIEDCKGLCLRSHFGLYACRAFVYDWVNQVCDLLSHLGDRPPAKLMKYENCDYYEPNSSLQTCLQGRLASTEPDLVIKQDVSIFKQYIAPKKNPQTRIDGKKIVELEAKRSCEPGKTPAYLRIPGFELYQNDHFIADSVNLEECLDFCTNNKGGTKVPDCRSFDYSTNHCTLSTETAVPLGKGQLKQNAQSDYYEKICLDETVNTMRGCPKIFDRYPQMILVGYAEVVTDAPTFEDCFEQCFNSTALYGIQCISGMYYFEEAKLNCILNIESRTTQSELFTEENSDFVDYFELNCRKESTRQMNFEPATTIPSTTTSRKPEVPFGEWGEWSECSKSNFQTRFRMCRGRPCGNQGRNCYPALQRAMTSRRV